MKNDVIWFQQQLTARKIVIQNALILDRFETCMVSMLKFLNT